MRHPLPRQLIRGVTDDGVVIAISNQEQAIIDLLHRQPAGQITRRALELPGILPTVAAPPTDALPAIAQIGRTSEAHARLAGRTVLGKLLLRA